MKKLLILFIPLLMFAEESITIKYLNGIEKKSFNGNTNDLRRTYNKVEINYLNGISKSSFDNGKNWIIESDNKISLKEVKTIIIDDIFTFEEFLEIKNYKAIDFNGREVILKINGNRIDATNLNKGIYFLFIETENENKQFKINKIN